MAFEIVRQLSPFGGGRGRILIINQKMNSLVKYTYSLFYCITKFVKDQMSSPCPLQRGIASARFYLNTLFNLLK